MPDSFSIEAFYRDLVEIRGWAEELADDHAIATHPRAGAVLGAAAEAAYLRGDYPRAERLARAGLERATDDVATWCCRKMFKRSRFRRPRIASHRRRIPAKAARVWCAG